MRQSSYESRLYSAQSAYTSILSVCPTHLRPMGAALGVRPGSAISPVTCLDQLLFFTRARHVVPAM